jgi:hypothetical protein
VFFILSFLSDVEYNDEFEDNTSGEFGGMRQEAEVAYIKVKVEKSCPLCLTKYHAMKTWPLFTEHHAMKM